MLQNIRDNSQGIVAKVIIGLIVVSFAFFGLQSLVGGGGADNVAFINGEELSAIELNQAITVQRNRLISVMGESVDPALLDVNRLRSPALDQLIQQRLLLQAAAVASIGIADNAIDQAIVAMPQFQEEGQFSGLLYQSILRSNGYSPAYFKQLVANNLLLNQLTSGIADSDFVTEKELAATAKIIGQKRSFRYFMLPLEKVAGQIAIDDTDIQQYYSDHINNFQTEDRVKLTYIEVKQQDFFKPVADQDLKAAYEVDMKDFEVDEERRASHILIEINAERNKEQATALIKTLIDRINKGETFAALAENFSEDSVSANAGGDLGYTSGDTFPPEFEQALFALALNQLSEPIQTDAGYHLILATDIKTKDKPSFEDRKPILQQRLQLAAAEKEFVRSVEALRDIVFNSGDLAGPAKELGLKVTSTDWFGKNTAKGVMANPQVLAAAYSNDVLVERNNSEVIELSTDHFIVLRRLDHEAARAKELAEVRSEITATLNRLKTTELAMALAEKSIVELSQGKTVEALAQASGYEWQVAQNVTRNATQVNREILSAAFQMTASLKMESTEHQVSRKAVSLANGDVAVIQLEKVEEGGWSDFSAAEQGMIKAELNRNYGNSGLGSFMGALRENADIEIL